jgi:hypothetical protein
MSQYIVVKNKKDIVLGQSTWFDVNVSELKESIADFMKDYDEDQERKLGELRNKSENADEEDGFVMVKPR